MVEPKSQHIAGVVVGVPRCPKYLEQEESAGTLEPSLTMVL